MQGNTEKSYYFVSTLVYLAVGVWLLSRLMLSNDAVYDKVETTYLVLTYLEETDTLAIWSIYVSVSRLLERPANIETFYKKINRFS